MFENWGKKKTSLRHCPKERTLCLRMAFLLGRQELKWFSVVTKEILDEGEWSGNMDSRIVMLREDQLCFQIDDLSLMKSTNT